jgi:hypothetical protein
VVVPKKNMETSCSINFHSFNDVQEVSRTYFNGQRTF